MKSVFIFLIFLKSSFSQKEYDPRKTQCPRELWLFDEDVVCSKGNLGGSYCLVYCGNGLRSETAECICGKFCKWTLGKPTCYDPTLYEYSVYGDYYEYDSEEDDGLSADSVRPIEKIKTTTEEPTTAELTTTTEEYTTTTEEETTTVLPTTVLESTTRKSKKSETDRLREKQAEKARKQAERKDRKKQAKLAEKDKKQKKMCPESSWMDNGKIKCTDGAAKLSVCTISCQGEKEKYAERNLETVCKCENNICSWNLDEGPQCELKFVKEEKNKEEKIKTEKIEEPASLAGDNMCEYHEWFDNDEVLCSHGLFNNTLCVLNECPHRQMSTEVTCECFVKEDKVIKCKWQEEGKDEYNRKGPRCIRKSKRGILDESCLPEPWHDGEEDVKCTDDYKVGSVCTIKKCETEKVGVPATCMCFSRANGATKCKWNRAPKCVAGAREDGEVDKDVFRSSVVTKSCPEPSWKYMESISCSDRYFSNSECKIDNCLGKLSPSIATCTCRGYACNWSYSLSTTEPTCVHVVEYQVPNGQMLMDFVNGFESFGEPEEGEAVDLRAITEEVCLLQSNPNVICSDENRDQSKCRRIDCKSNESRCICYQGRCQYDRGEPECMNQALIAPGCALNKGCNGCDIPDWMNESETQCTNFNHEGSQCYRSNCYYPLASTRATCICHMTKRNMPLCTWNSEPTCFLPTR